MEKKEIQEENSVLAEMFATSVRWHCRPVSGREALRPRGRRKRERTAEKEGKKKDEE